MSSIDTLLEKLKNSEDRSIESLEQILAENLPSREDIISISKAELPYGRTMLYLDEDLEVIIGCWPRGGWCDAHDHGPAIGVVHSYSGEIEHFSYEFDGTELNLVEQKTMRQDQACRLEMGMIHSLQNISSDEPYVGLHIYSPPTSQVRVFDLKNGDIYHVTDDFPALIPDKEENIILCEKEKFVFRNRVHTKVSS